MDRLIALVHLRFKNELRSILWARERLVSVLVALPGLLLSSLFIAAFAFVALRALLRSNSELLMPVMGGLASVLGLLWALSPLLSGVALVESHDLSRLLHFPIPLRVLVVSSLIANLAQPAVLSQVPPLVAVTLALSPGLERAPLVFAGLVVSLIFILTAAQTSGLAMHGLARNRRFHDRALFFGLGLSFLLSALPVALMMGGSRALDWLRRVAAVLEWFPFAWGARAAVHAARGENTASISLLAAGVLATLAMLGLASVLIERVYRGELDLGGPAQERGGRSRMRFEGSFGALLEKDLRSAWRDPAMRASLLVGFLGPLLVLFFLSQARFGGRGGAVLWLSSFIGLSAFGSNALGFERRGIALLLGFPIPRWRLLLGKNLTALLLRAPGFLTLVAAVSFAPLTIAPAAFAIALSTFLIAAGMDNFFSILFPIAAPEPGRNPFGHASGARGLGAALASGMFLMGALVLSSPFAFLEGWLPLRLRNPWISLVTLPLGLAGAACTYALLLAGAAHLLERREPDLLERILGEA